ncbi:MAG: hypothetical protein AAAFM81_15045 [Pseudomonadota bacterium]
MKMSKTALRGTLLFAGFCLVLAGYSFLAMDGKLDGHWNEIEPLDSHKFHTDNHPHMSSNSSFKLRECWFLCRYVFRSPQFLQPRGWEFMSLYDLTPTVREFLKGTDGMPDDICQSECVFGGFRDKSRKVHIFIMDWQEPNTGDCPDGKDLCAKFYMVLLSWSDKQKSNKEPELIEPEAALSWRNLVELFSDIDELEIKHIGSAHSGGDFD